MQIDLRNLKRQRLFRVKIDVKRPPSIVRDPKRKEIEVYLNWDRAIDDQGYLRHCPVCGCRESYVRKDFHQATGMAIVIIAGLVAVWHFAREKVLEGVAVLGAVVLLDAVIWFATGRCLVCYRCRSEFRKLPIARDHPHWELSTGEKYRPINTDPASPDGAAARRTEQPEGDAADERQK